MSPRPRRGREKCEAVNRRRYLRPHPGALFARSENSFSFGPGYLIPEPSEGTLTFLGVREGRASHLLVEQTGVEPEIARRSDSGAVKPRNPRGCRPLRESSASLKAGRSG